MKSTSLGYYLFIFLFSCGLLGCQQNSTSSDTSHDASTETPANNTTRPVPDSLVGQIPVYDVFESIAPIFEQSSDTTYVINFWATWCKPCVAELPYFEQLTQNYNDQKVKVLLISLDFEKQLSTKLLPFVQERQLQSEVLSLADGKYNNWIDK
ncbi:MAG: TlpA disulfide reductase family protein, partial [Bacteroidota bacterium]